LEYWGQLCGLVSLRCLLRYPVYFVALKLCGASGLISRPPLGLPRKLDSHKSNNNIINYKQQQQPQQQRQRPHQQQQTTAATTTAQQQQQQSVIVVAGVIVS